MAKMFTKILSALLLIGFMTSCEKWFPKFTFYDGNLKINDEEVTFKCERSLLHYSLSEPFNSTVFEEDGCLYFYLEVETYGSGLNGMKGGLAFNLVIPDGIEIGKHYEINSCALCDPEWNETMGERVGAYMEYYPLCTDYISKDVLLNDSEYKSFNYIWESKGYTCSVDRIRMTFCAEEVEGYMTFYKFDRTTVSDKEYPAYDIVFKVDLRGLATARWDSSLSVPLTMKGKINATCVQYKKSMNPYSHKYSTMEYAWGSFMPSEYWK